MKKERTGSGSSGQVSVRKASASDIPSIISMWNEMMEMHRLFRSTYVCRKDAEELMRKHFRENIGKLDSRVLVAERNGKQMGYAMAEVKRRPPIYKEKDAVYISVSDIFVAGKYRRSGAGSMMMDAISDWAAKNGIRAISLEVDSKNAKAIAFYRKGGFAIQRHIMAKRC